MDAGIGLPRLQRVRIDRTNLDQEVYEKDAVDTKRIFSL